MVNHAVLLWGFLGRPIGRFIDEIVALFSLCCLLEFVLLKLLLAPHKGRCLLLTQLVLFLQGILTDFTWLYWPLDTRGLLQGQQYALFQEFWCRWLHQLLMYFMDGAAAV